MSRKLIILLVVLNLMVLVVAVFSLGALLGFGAQRSAFETLETAISNRWSARPADETKVAAEAPLLMQQSQTTDPTPLAVPERSAGSSGQVSFANQRANVYVRANSDISETDLPYIDALQKLVFDSTAGSELPASVPHKEFRKTRSQNSVDRFNRVYIEKPGKRATLSAQLEQLVADESLSEQQGSENKVEAGYITAVSALVVERQNQARTIRVKRGDTLFKIARRAYGDGDRYPEIFKANPHLRNPNKIEIGDILRVPK